MTAPEPDQAQALLRSLTRTLGAVAVLALVFTAVNVTQFATAHGILKPVAVLLDPMVALALATVLLADARLASWGIRPPGWSTALRWFTGLAATAMNTWTSLWPDGRIGWPHRADPAGVLLHAIPPMLLIGLTETVAAYRHLITQLPTIPGRTHPPGSAPPPAPPEPGAEDAKTSGMRSTTGPAPGDPTPQHSGQTPGDIGPERAHVPGSGPVPPPGTPAPQPVPESAVDRELFTRALALDTAHLSRTGRALSIRAIKEELHLGQPRARQVRTRLDAHRTPDVPASHIVPGQETSTA